MNAPLHHPVIKDSLITDAVNHPELPDGSAVDFLDLDFLDANKIAGETSYRLSTDAWR